MQANKVFDMNAGGRRSQNDDRSIAVFEGHWFLDNPEYVYMHFRRGLEKTTLHGIEGYAMKRKDFEKSGVKVGDLANFKRMKRTVFAIPQGFREEEEYEIIQDVKREIIASKDQKIVYPSFGSNPSGRPKTP